MKKITILFILFLTLFSCADEKGNLHITGDIKGLSQGKLYIQRINDTVLKPIKVIKFDGDSKFETYLNVEEPEVLYLFLDRGVSNSLDNNIAFFAEKGELKIISDVNSFIGKAEIMGGDNQNLLNDYNKVMKNYANKNVDYIQQRIKADLDKNLVLSDSLRRMEDVIMKRKYLYTIDFCLKNADKEIAPYLAVSQIYDANPKFLDSIHNSLSEQVLKSKYGKIFTEYLSELKVQ